ncbi:hypothetical protein GOODEAATRI_028021, partial [Goodea atripinnis]
ATSGLVQTLYSSSSNPEDVGAFSEVFMPETPSAGNPSLLVPAEPSDDIKPGVSDDVVKTSLQLKVNPVSQTQSLELIPELQGCLVRNTQ